MINEKLLKETVKRHWILAGESGPRAERIDITDLKPKKGKKPKYQTG